MKKKSLSHLDKNGRARMVDIGNKAETERVAEAEAVVKISKELLAGLRENNLGKGDALSVAQLAGISAAKRTSELIPLCHQIPLNNVSVELTLSDNPPSVRIISRVSAHYKTGVEMEALTAVSVAALTIYDMGKSIDKGIIIESIKLLKKRGGKSGDWVSKDQD